MFQPHFEDTTATAIIEGLAIAKYNETESKWETTFLRNCGHYPRIIIRKVERTSGKVIEIIRTYEIADGDSISISVTNPKAGTGWQFITGADFDRNDAGHDAQDLRWMLNIDELMGKKVKRKMGEIGTNTLTTTDGCFYTSVRTSKIYRKRWINAQGIRSPIEPIGLTGKTFGADFRGDSVTIGIKGAAGFTETVEYSPDERFEFIFDNTCVGEYEPPAGETDFRFYYKLIDDSEGRVEIYPPEGSTASGDPAPLDPEPEPEPETIDSDQDPKTPACHSIMEEGGVG